MATIQHTNTATDGSIVYTWTGMAAFDTEPLYVRPKATGGGASTSVTCILLVRGDN